MHAKKVQTCDKLWTIKTAVFTLVQNHLKLLFLNPLNAIYLHSIDIKPSSRLKCYQVTGAMFLKRIDMFGSWTLFLSKYYVWMILETCVMSLSWNMKLHMFFISLVYECTFIFIESCFGFQLCQRYIVTDVFTGFIISSLKFCFPFRYPRKIPTTVNSNPNTPTRMIATL